MMKSRHNSHWIIVQLVVVFSIFVDVVNSLQASDFYVHDLPLLPKSSSSIRMHAGQLPVNPQHDGALFFWHFADISAVKKSKTVIWLSGGPGVSSVDEAWLEMGPFRFDESNRIVENNASWHLLANLLFIDQPVGVGFSYIDKDSFLHDLDEMANQFLHFLDRYIEIFPELLDEDIYLVGSSFAGQYIPYIAQAILDKRSAFKLRGLLIGNGWIDPQSIYMSYLPFAVEKNLIEKDSGFYNETNEMVKICQAALSKKIHVFEYMCQPILNHIVFDSPNTDYYAKTYKYKCMNLYDLRLANTNSNCEMNGWLQQESVTTYLQREDVMSRIHVDRKKVNWTYFSDSVYDAFNARHSVPSINLLPDLLRRISIVLYNGEYDFICNHRSTETMIDQMSWNNRTGFDLGNGALAPIESWIVDGESVGRIRSARNLTYILFYNAGHSVAYDQPYRARVMLQQFIELNSNSKETTQSKHHNSKRIVILTVSIIITVVVLLGLVWFSVYKSQQSRIPTPFSIIRILRSKTRGLERQQWMVYSQLQESNEDLHAPNNETLV